MTDSTIIKTSISKVEDLEINVSKDKKLSYSKDGGWGWIIVLASLSSHMLNDGVIYAYGVLAPGFIKHFEISRSTFGWMGSILVAVTLATGPLASYLCNRFSYRKVAVVGSVLSSVGFAAPYFHRELWFVIFSSSILCGIGLGLVYLPSIVIVNIWFRKKRPLAIGIAVSGSGLGTLVFSFLLEYLTGKYGWELTMLITGAILLLLIPCSLTYIDLPPEAMNQDGNVSNAIEIETSLHFNNIGKNIEQNESVLDSNIINCSNNNFDRKSEVDTKISVYEMIKNPVFILYVVSTVLSSIGFNAPYMFVMDRALQLGVSSVKSSLLISFIGIGNCFGRIGFGCLGSLKGVNRFHLFNIGVITSGLILIVSWVMNEYFLMILYTLIYGMMTGAFVTLTPIILVDIFGIQNLDNVFGYSLVFQGIAVLVGPPLTGLIYDFTLSYNIAFSFCGILITASGVMMYLAYLSKDFRKKIFY